MDNARAKKIKYTSNPKAGKPCFLRVYRSSNNKRYDLVDHGGSVIAEDEVWFFDGFNRDTAVTTAQNQVLAGNDSDFEVRLRDYNKARLWWEIEVVLQAAEAYGTTVQFPGNSEKMKDVIQKMGFDGVKTDYDLWASAEPAVNPRENDDPADIEQLTEVQDDDIRAMLAKARESRLGKAKA